MVRLFRLNIPNTNSIFIGPDVMEADICRSRFGKASILKISSIHYSKRDNSFLSIFPVDDIGSESIILI